MAENKKEACWYVIHTYSGYENKVKDTLEKSVENNGMQDLILDVRVPMEEVMEIRNGKRVKSTRKVRALFSKGVPRSQNTAPKKALTVMIRTAFNNPVWSKWYAGTIMVSRKRYVKRIQIPKNGRETILNLFIATTPHLPYLPYLR